MLVKASERRIQLSAHGNQKQVILGANVLPEVTQVAVAVWEEPAETEVHQHPTMYESYLVLEGRAVYTVGGVAYEVGPGDFVSVPPATPHNQRILEAPHRIFYWGIAVGPRTPGSIG